MAGQGATPRRRVERAMALDGGKPLDQYASNRNCTHPQCSARLSRYNPNPTCAAHGGWAENPEPRRRNRSRTEPV
ncbi:MAG: hypothetical protein M3387_14185 [Actinomycetota bacterium]|nr:hypothetical protein [Actinomycetota bacterium]